MNKTYHEQYHTLLGRILVEGTKCEDRTGVSHWKVFDETFYYNLYNDDISRFLPILKTRKVSPRIAFYELMWMLNGSTDVEWLQEKDIHIWNGNSTREFLDSVGLRHIRKNHIGKAYGYQFRNSNGVDQLNQVYKDLLNKKFHRRHMIDLWNTNDMKEMALPPCVYSYQFVPIGNTLNLKVVQRSCDFILGQPYNAMFSSMFLIFMAAIVGMQPGTVAHSMTDIHIYDSHMDAAGILLDRYNATIGNREFDDRDSILMLSDKLIGFDVHFHQIDSIDHYLSCDMDSLDDLGTIYRYEPMDPLLKDLLKMAV